MARDEDKNLIGLFSTRSKVEEVENKGQQNSLPTTSNPLFLDKINKKAKNSSDNENVKKDLSELGNTILRETRAVLGELINKQKEAIRSITEDNIIQGVEKVISQKMANIS